MSQMHTVAFMGVYQSMLKTLLIPVHGRQGLTLPASAFLGASAQNSHRLRQPYVQCWKDDTSGRQPYLVCNETLFVMSGRELQRAG